jgi:Sap, sulfolipid-1-addressing protein
LPVHCASPVSDDVAPTFRADGAAVQSLIPTVIGLGLAIALCSPVSIVTVIVLLTMPSGRRRGIAFVLGWLLAIGVIAAVVVGFAHGQDFSSHKTTPSRVASWIEIAVGLVAVFFASRALRRRRGKTSSSETPKWLDRLDRTNWLLAVLVGAFMLTYSLTIAAAAEILKAHVSTEDDVLAFALFALASITTIAAPIAVALAAPDRADQRLAAWRAWLLGNSRLIGLIALIVIGAALIAKGAHDLVA